MIGLVGAVCCTIGILVGGSRGGLVAACIGLLLTLFLVRHKRGYYGTPVAILMVIAGVTFSLVPMNLKLESVERLEALTRDQSAMSGQNRLSHWRDGWHAAWGHFPAGSGLGTYAYAYLPFQEFSSPTWYHHADNLWLELITEQGVVGIVLTLAIFAIAIRSIRVLAESPDPIDHGLRITGTFCLIAITVTQLFDFGLIVFGNLIAVTLLLPVLVARSSIVLSQHCADREARTRGRIDTTNSSMPTGRARRQTVLVIGLAVVAVGLSAAPIPTLRQNARIEFLDREVTLNLTPSQSDRQRLAKLLERLNTSPDKDDSPTLLLAESDVRYLLARLDDTIASNPSTPEAIVQRYQETGPFAKRLKWATHVGTTGSINASAEAEFSQHVATPEYEESFTLAQRSLTAAPTRSAGTNEYFVSRLYPQKRRTDASRAAATRATLPTSVDGPDQNRPFRGRQRRSRIGDPCMATSLDPRTASHGVSPGNDRSIQHYRRPGSAA